ncbi:hypothetical protein BDV11DRAFT_19609 [Aspergillus similis]
MSSSSPSKMLPKTQTTYHFQAPCHPHNNHAIHFCSEYSASSNGAYHPKTSVTLDYSQLSWPPRGNPVKKIFSNAVIRCLVLLFLQPPQDSRSHELLGEAEKQDRPTSSDNVPNAALAPQLYLLTLLNPTFVLFFPFFTFFLSGLPGAQPICPD